jgi:hypothetical protein
VSTDMPSFNLCVAIYFGYFFLKKSYSSDFRQEKWITTGKVCSLLCMLSFQYLYINLAVLENSHTERGNALHIFFVFLLFGSPTAFHFDE